MLRHFMDNLVLPEDSEIFLEAACLLNLQDSPVSLLADPEDIQIDPDLDPTTPQLEKLQIATARARELRISTSDEAIRSYEEIKAEKHFFNPLNLRQINTTHTGLLRMGTGMCCFFQEITG